MTHQCRRLAAIFLPYEKQYMPITTTTSLFERFVAKLRLTGGYLKNDGYLPLADELEESARVHGDQVTFDADLAEQGIAMLEENLRRRSGRFVPYEDQYVIKHIRRALDKPSYGSGGGTPYRRAPSPPTEDRVTAPEAATAPDREIPSGRYRQLSQQELDSGPYRSQEEYEEFMQLIDNTPELPEVW
ncbi:hypothetical protein [Caulobacter sp. 17J80-11]|uniref:hypothetical protein n=1 Tax=Caulobacter sp. 17J80-11 TaxID=2763502 RepID=UPI001653A51A|nr:hypothetical protein [Caulobacter sp. 17J80-11]MBC6982897.1 hypothetical protein [Caulobacter sp. 17J80-11]